MVDNPTEVPIEIAVIATAPADTGPQSDTVIKQESSQPDYEEQSTELIHRERRFKDELGWCGKFFGGRREKSGNIAALTIIISILFLIGAFLLNAFGYSGTIEYGIILSSFISIVTLALGYMFGSNDNNSD